MEMEDLEQAHDSMGGMWQETVMLIENVLGNIESRVKLLVVNPFGSIKNLEIEASSTCTSANKS